METQKSLKPYMKNQKSLKSNAVILNTKGDLEYKAIEISNPFTDGVLLKTQFCGICGSDLHRIRNKNGSFSTLGHEVVAVVEEPQSPKLKKGNFVVVSPIVSCGKCKYCESGSYQFCESAVSVGKNFPGGFSEYFYAPEKNCIRINSLEEKYVLADPISVCLHAINKADEISEKDKVLIIGDGTVGICLHLTLKLLYNKNSDLIGRHSFVKRYIKHGKHIKYDDNLKNDLNNKYDIVFEAVGGDTEKTVELAVNATNFLGRIVVLGVFPKEKHLQMYFRNLFYKEVKLIGSNSYSIAQDKKYDEFEKAVELLSKFSEYDELVTHKFTQQNYANAIKVATEKLDSVKVALAY